MDLDTFIAKWRISAGAERSNSTGFLYELCDVLKVPRPEPSTGNAEHDRYVFEKPVYLPHEGRRTKVGSIDLYKDGCFLLEAKQGTTQTGKKRGALKRETAAWHNAMHDARGQAFKYLALVDQPPPFVIVCDIGYCFDLYATFGGTATHRPFPSVSRHRIYFKDLPEHLDMLRRIFVDPASLDPSTVATQVTKEVAEHLAKLARSLAEAGYAPERVVSFLTRCIFTMFAENIGLFREHIFTKAIEQNWIPRPSLFKDGMESLWRAMDEGTHFGSCGSMPRFNGGLFCEPQAIPLGIDDLKTLLDAAKCDWTEVEPAILGTLLGRVLDGKERHSVRANFTPRAYVQRLVHHTIEEPLREEWRIVQAQARQHRARRDPDAACAAVKAFHEKLCRTRVLDGAAGTGNFLYVALDFFKHLDAEVLRHLSDLGGKTKAALEGTRHEITPGQFLGIELNPRAKKIADLILWLGYLQAHVREKGHGSNPTEPILRDYQNIECRDALLNWDQEEVVCNESGERVTRGVGESTIVYPVAGKLVPDEDSSITHKRRAVARGALWPEADFIVGNPPFVGNKRMRSTFGNRYVDAIRTSHSDVPESADLVMYWWNRAATLVEEGKVRRFGLVTTNNIGHGVNGRVVQKHLDKGSILFAVHDHPWFDAGNGTPVRVAMSVFGPGYGSDGILQKVVNEHEAEEGDRLVETSARRGRISATLDIDPGVIRLLRPEHQNQDGMTQAGMSIVGAIRPNQRPTQAPLVWPAELQSQIMAVLGVIRRGGFQSGERVAGAFAEAPVRDVTDILDSLERVGLAVSQIASSPRQWVAVDAPAILAPKRATLPPSTDVSPTIQPGTRFDAAAA